MLATMGLVSFALVAALITGAQAMPLMPALPIRTQRPCQAGQTSVFAMLGISVSTTAPVHCALLATIVQVATCLWLVLLALPLLLALPPLQGAFVFLATTV